MKRLHMIFGMCWRWYRANQDRVLLFTFILLIFSITVIYIPYVNIILSPAFSASFILLVWYILFRPTVAVMIGCGFFLILVCLLLSVIGVESITEFLGIWLWIISALTLHRAFHE